MLAKVLSSAVLGIDGYIVEVEGDNRGRWFSECFSRDRIDSVSIEKLCVLRINVPKVVPKVLDEYPVDCRLSRIQD